MRKVYICSPYRAKDGAELDRNIDYAQQLTRQALEAGLAPITPHLYMTQCMDDKKPEERARGMAAGLALLPTVQILRYMPLGRTGKCRTTKRGNNNAFGDREQQAA